MKKLFLSIVLLFVLQNSFSQSPPACQFVPYPEMENNSNYSNRYQIIPNTDGPFVINLKFHGVHGANGEDIHNVNEARFLRMTARLNEVYNTHNIFFKYRGFNILKDPNFINIGYPGQHTMVELVDEYKNKGLYDYSSLNIFVSHGPSSGGPNEVWCSTTFADEGDYGFYNYMLPHEMGHMLGLYHVQSRSMVRIELVLQNIVPCTYSIFFPTINQMKKPIHPIVQPLALPNENVTRDPASINFNADHAGDKVIDTQASFDGFTGNYCKNSVNGQFLGNVWNEHPEVTDFVGETYKCTAVESHNIMSAGIPESFTLGQGKRMREHIVGNFNNIFKQKMSMLDDDSADMAVLYEPFALGATNGTGNPVVTAAFARTITPNTTNTGVNIWNCGPFVARYQPGFNYEFTNASGQLTTQTIYQQYNTSCTNFIGVKIPLLGQDIINTAEPQCFSSFEAYIKGEVKSLDNLGSYYLSIQELDAIKASNPNLYDELQSGKYHIIIKETTSGYIDQKVMYKN